jgi:rhodanese-related sulfurtransferase
MARGSILSIQSATPSEIKLRLDRGDDLLLIDVREPHEIAVAAITGAVVCPLSQAANWIDRVPAGRELVLICHHGIRSMHAAMALAERGHTDLINMTGGIDLWSQQVDPSVPRY